MTSRPGASTPLISRWYVWLLAAAAALVAGVVFINRGSADEFRIRLEQGGHDSYSVYERAINGVPEPVDPVSLWSTGGQLLLWLALGLAIAAIVAPWVWRNRQRSSGTLPPRA